MSRHHVAVVIGGGPIGHIAMAAAFDRVIAADSGFDAAVAAGLEPTLVVGDLDSISAAGLAAATAAGISVERHDPGKDDTDTSLALRRAAEAGATDVTVLGPCASDRLDHLLGAITAMGHPVLGGCTSVTGHLGGATMHVVHPGHSVSFELGRGGVFSLLALHGPCSGVTVTGARWPLDAAPLAPASTLGISNESLGGRVTIAVATGVVTAIIPHHQEQP
jgi:thiamine pyrophosphokinase